MPLNLPTQSMKGSTAIPPTQSTIIPMATRGRTFTQASLAAGLLSGAIRAFAVDMQVMAERSAEDLAVARAEMVAALAGMAETSGDDRAVPLVDMLAALVDTGVASAGMVVGIAEAALRTTASRRIRKPIAESGCLL
jgi:hypothetical protein